MADVQLEVVGIRIELPANQPILLLKDSARSRFLPIWIGSAEAQAASIVMRGLEPPRPLSHNLMVDIMAAYGDSAERVVISGHDHHVFLAQIHTREGKVISARPSDAVPVALLSECPVYTTAELIEEMGVDGPAPDEDEVAQFRQFLDQVSPEDFEPGEGGAPDEGGEDSEE